MAFFNDIALSVLVAWGVAQAGKILTRSKRKKLFYPKAFLEGGGMPSGHTAFVVALATAVGIQEGYSSAVFYVALAFAIIVMYEVLLTKKAMQQLADIVTNRYTEEMVEKLGHTFAEIGIGLLIGIIIPVLIMLY